MDKIPGFLIPGSGVLSYPGIKKSRDWNFQKIPGLNDWKDPGILASLVHAVFPWFRWRVYSNARKVYENQTNSIRVHLGTLFSFRALYLKGDLASSAKVLPYSWTWTPTDVRCLMEIDSSHAMTISSRPVGRFSNPGGPIKSIPPVFKISL